MKASEPYKLTHGIFTGPTRQQESSTSTPIRIEQGLSAYDIAVKNGFVGSEGEWLVSLQAQGGVLWNQQQPSASWYIPHSLGRNPDVTIYIDDDQVFADVEATNLEVIITFPSPMSGKAILI